MAFGMSTFPLRFGAGQGGAASDPTRLTPAVLAALGLTYARTGAVHGRRSPGGPGNYVRHEANDPELDFEDVDGTSYPSLVVRSAATPLVSYSADLTNAAWTKTNMTAELQTGSLESAGEANGHTLLTATDANATVTRALTRSSVARQSRVRITAPATNAGTVKVSHNNGSTSVTVAAGEFEDIVIPEVTSANPTLWIQNSDPGDQARVYDFQHFELATGTPPPRTVPQGASPAAVGAASCTGTIGVAPASADLDVLLTTPAVNGYRILVVGTSSNRFIDLHRTAATLRLFGSNSTVTSYAVDKTPGAVGSLALLRATVAAGANNVTLSLDGDTASTATASQAIPSVTDIALGHFPSPSSQINMSIIAIRDRGGQVFGTPGAGFNVEAIERASFL